MREIAVAVDFILHVNLIFIVHVITWTSKEVMSMMYVMPMNLKLCGIMIMMSHSHHFLILIHDSSLTT
jgi:hypothetical protein